MDGGSPPRKLRKGTKSCVECRKRKVRCVWLSDDARACRRCEERGSSCIAQSLSTVSPHSIRLSSRARIDHLEQRVTTLTNALHKIETKLGHELTQADAYVPMDAEAAQSDTESDTSGTFPANGPAYLQSLFNNDTLSSDNRDIEIQGLTRRSQAALIDKARGRLQTLIPSRDETTIIASSADPWLVMYQTLFDTGYNEITGQSIIAQYDEMKGPDAHPVHLASWLVMIAITARQKAEDGSELLTGFKNALQYCRVVASAVEQTVLSQDRFLSTIEGIQAAIHILRLHLSLGNFTRMWMLLRRVIAMSELIGLPQISRAFKVSQENFDTDRSSTAKYLQEEHLKRKMKVETWTAVCTVDRIAGMMLNLPAGTKNYPSNDQNLIDSNGVINLRAYLRKLADIAMDGHDLHDYTVGTTSDADLYAKILELDRRLSSLADLAPRDWWNHTQSHFTADQILVFWHYYITLRTHLPFTLRHDSSHQFDYSRFSCMNACQSLLRRFPGIRRTMPRAFFASRVLDLQVLTAAVVYLLTYYNLTSVEDKREFQRSIESPDSVIPQVVEAMRSILDQTGSDFARKAISTIRSLTTLLSSTDNNEVQDQDLTLKVPMLGKIHVRRAAAGQNNRSHHHVPSAAQYNTQTRPSQLPNQHQSQSQAQTQLPTNSLLGSPLFIQDQPPPPPFETPNFQQSQDLNTSSNNNSWMWDPLSWSIEDDHESSLQDALMLEEYYSPFDFASTIAMGGIRGG